MLTNFIENKPLILNQKRKLADLITPHRTKGLECINEYLCDIDLMKIARSVCIGHNWYSPVSYNPILEHSFYLIEIGSYLAAFYAIALSLEKNNEYDKLVKKEATVARAILTAWLEIAYQSKSALNPDDRNIPKKPLWGGYTDPVYADDADEVTCPICGYSFGSCDEESWYLKENNFCKNCGQAIFWD